MKKLIKEPAGFLWIFVSIFILQACYPGDSIPITDLDTVTTLYNSDDFATKPTSASLIWEVVQIKDDAETDLPYDGKQDVTILNTTLNELVKLYGEDNVFIISETADPSPSPSNGNVQVLVPGTDFDPVPNVNTIYAPSVVLREQTIVYTYPGYGWYGWWGYPCYYCGYPSYGSSTYEVGTVVLEMYDLTKIPPGGQIPSDFDMSWVAALKGLLSSNPQTAKDRIESGIQKAFEQSSYLDPNK